MPTPDAAYDAIADWYDARVREGSLLHDLVIPGVLGLAGDLAGRSVCDLACGQGAIARALARRGASVTGIDLSERMLEIARRDDVAEPLGISYRWGDIQDPDMLAGETFDGVVCGMALMDVPDVGAAIQTAHRLLRPGGWFVCAVTHPCFQTPESDSIPGQSGPARRVSAYFREGFWRSEGTGGCGRVGAWHRTLGTYLNLLAAARFRIERVEEPAADGAIGERLPEFREVAAVLIVRCRKDREYG